MAPFDEVAPFDEIGWYRFMKLSGSVRRNRSDMAKLEFLSRKNNVLPLLGFYLELTATMTKDRKLQSFARKLKDHRKSKMELFFVGRPDNEFERELAERNTPPVARRW